MSRPECDHLDEYLLGWLPAGEAAAFEGHLAACSECRNQREVQDRIDRAVELARSQPEPAPPLLVGRIHRRIGASRGWRIARIACGLAAAAAVLVVFAARGWFEAGSAGLPPGTELAAEGQPVPVPAVAAADEARVRMTDPSSAILVSMPSRNPEITIVWVYPTVKPDDTAGPSASQ